MEKGKEMGFQLYILLFFNQEKNNFPESPLLVVEPSTSSRFPFVFHWPGLGLAARNSGQLLLLILGREKEILNKHLAMPAALTISKNECSGNVKDNVGVENKDW